MNDFLARLRVRFPYIVAVAATTLWIAAIAGYVRALGGVTGLGDLAPADLAILVAGVTGPIILLWLIVAIMGQGRAVVEFGRRLGELAAQNRQSLQQAESHARALLQLQAQAARMQVLETRRLGLQEMAASAGVLAERLGVMKHDAVNAAWARYGAGDINVFVQSFLSFAVSHPDIDVRMAEAVARDAVAGVALATFVRRYERLVEACGDDKLAAEIFDDGALGRAYRLFKSADAQAATLLAGDTAPPADDAAADSVSEDDLFARRRLAGLAARLESAAPPA